MRFPAILVLVPLLLASAATGQCRTEVLSVGGPFCERARFGWAVALWQDTAVVTAPDARDPGCGGNRGKVFLFQRNAAAKTWKLTDVLKMNPPLPPGGGESFGHDVAIRGGTIVVVGVRKLGWVFEKVAGKWKSTQLSSGAQTSPTSCAISKDFIALGIGLSNLVNIYEKPVAGWTSVPSLSPKWTLKVTRVDDLALSGNRLAIIWTHTAKPTGSRVVFYDHFLGSWIQAGSFAADHAIQHLGGGRIDVHADLAVVSHFRFHGGAKPVLLIQRDTTGKWLQRARFTGTEWLYGGSIALSRDAATRGRVIVGAPSSGHPGTPGAYVYDPVDPGKLDRWNVRKLTVGTIAAGGSVALSGRLALIGDVNPVGAQSRAYVFEIGGSKQSGSFVTYAASCQGGGGRVPRHAASGTPEIAADVTLSLSNARANAPAALLVGAVRKNIPLDVIGMTGCRLLTDPIVQVGAVTDASGALAVKVKVPCDMRSVGAKVTSQLAVIDFGAPHPLKIVSTNGVEMTIGGFK